jgi:hypothetical protein
MRHGTLQAGQFDALQTGEWALAKVERAVAIARSMNAPLRALSAFVVAILFAGCFQSEVVISVKPDGSGTVTETMLMSKAMVEQMKMMSEGFGKLTAAAGEAANQADPAAKTAKPEGAAARNGFDLLDEKKLKEAAAKMGTGVTFVSAKKHSTDKGEGYIATYAFTDINQLRIDQEPSDSMPDAGPGMQVKKEGKSEPLTFQFKKGKTAELIVKNPADLKPAADQPKTDKPAAADAPGGEEMALMMMQQMFKDMKVTIAIEVVGKVVKTNAEHVSGNRATLMEMDFNKLLTNPAKLKELGKANPNTLAETKALLKGVEGVKVESQPSVSIQFQ